jgi:hypothetical protein
MVYRLFLAGTLLGATGLLRADPSRSDLHFVVYTSVEDKGHELLDSLRELGYDNQGNSVTDNPEDNYLVKWGGATSDQIDEIGSLCTRLFHSEFDRQQTLSNDDYSVFISLPLREHPPAPTRAELVITVHCDSEDLGHSLLSALSDAGYTNDNNSLQSGVNEPCSIEYGGAPDSLIDDLADRVARVFSGDIDKTRDLADDAHEVNINLPKEK